MCTNKTKSKTLIRLSLFVLMPLLALPAFAMQKDSMEGSHAMMMHDSTSNSHAMMKKDNCMANDHSMMKKENASDNHAMKQEGCMSDSHGMKKNSMMEMDEMKKGGRSGDSGM
jgi:hypothetical protein